MEKADLDGDGEIHYSEFRTWSNLEPDDYLVMKDLAELRRDLF